MLLTLENPDRPEEVQSVTLEIFRELRDIPDLEVGLPAQTTNVGDRGAGSEIFGQVLIAFVTGGAATALINCLNAYLQRDRSLKLRIKREDGSEVELTSASVRTHDVSTLFGSLRNAEFGDSEHPTNA
jgi:hypothetical protein